MPSKIQRVRISSGAIAADGTATAYSSPICGKILAVEIDYPAATCTVDIDTDGELKAQKILDLAAANTDVVLYPRVDVCDNTGGASPVYGTGFVIVTEFVVNGRLKLAIASGTATQVVTVDVFYEAF
jgi:hypothetical protein